MTSVIALSPRSSVPSPNARHGAVLVGAMWILVVVAGLVLVMAQSVHTEAIAAGNRLSALQAEAAAHAAEQYVMSVVDGVLGDSVSVTSINTEAIPVGDAYFWILRSD